MNHPPFDPSDTAYVFEFTPRTPKGTKISVNGREVLPLFKIWHKKVQDSADGQEEKLWYIVEYWTESVGGAPIVDWLTAEYCQEYYRGNITRWDWSYGNLWNREFRDSDAAKDARMAFLERREARNNHQNVATPARRSHSQSNVLSTPASNSQSRPNVSSKPQPISHQMVRRSHRIPARPNPSTVNPRPTFQRAQMPASRMQTPPSSVPEDIEINPQNVSARIIPAQNTIFEESIRQMTREEREIERGGDVDEDEPMEESVYESHSRAMIEATSIYSLVCNLLGTGPFPLQFLGTKAQGEPCCYI